MNTENEMPEMNPGMNPPPSHAVSLYGQADAMDDFPVLKAFQQYVDAEQAKAHKRLMSVCIFFTVLMTIVIAVFVVIILGLNRNAKDPALLALSETNAAIQRQMLEQTARMNETLMAQLLNRSASPVASSNPTIDAEVQRQNLDLKAKVQALELEKRYAAAEAQRPTPSLSDAEKIAKERELEKKENLQNARDAKLAEREAKLQAEAKRLRDKEIDLQRRNLYPDAYSPEAREKADQEIKAAQAESQRAKDEAKAAEAKALSAEQRAQEALSKAREAQEKAEDAERAALLEKARLEARSRQLAEEVKKLEADRAVLEAEAEKAKAKDLPPLPEADDTDTVHPVENEADAEGGNAVDEIDSTLRFLDELKEEDEKEKNAGREESAKTAPDVQPEVKTTEDAGTVQENGTIRFFDENDYELPCE